MTLQVDVEGLAHGGAAIAHLPDGRVAFVHGGCPGDIAHIEITAEHARHVDARVVDLVKPSPDRVDAPCPYFGTCGGCQWQHVAYDLQQTAKRASVVAALSRIGGVDAESLVDATLVSERQYGYRNKIELLGQWCSDGLHLGYAQAGTGDLVQVDSCLLLPRAQQKAPKALRGALRYLSGDNDLGIERVGLRIATNTRDVEVALWTAPDRFPRAFAAATVADTVKANSLVRVLVKSGTRGVSNVEVLKGKGAWRERLAGHAMLVSAPSFFQVNTSTAELLVRYAVEQIDPDSCGRVLDLYAGVGTFSIPLAERAEQTVAVESSRFALRDLERNAEQAQVPLDIVPGDAARALVELGTFDRVLVDPPRAGLDKSMLSSLAATRAGRIVYVSCDPATLARDVKGLGEHGYRLVRAQPVDLFPQTYHVETVATLDLEA